MPIKWIDPCISYGGEPKPKAGVHNIPKPMKSNIVGMDFAALESKVSGGGVHPSFEIDKDITSQEFKVAMKIPSHYTTVAVPFSTMEHATHTGGLQPFLDELAKMLMHELTMKALAYLEASFTKSD